MCSKRPITKSTGSFSDSVKRLCEEIQKADAVLIGAGAGLSASAGFDYSGERFERYFSDFHQKYGINDMYSGGFYPFETLEEYWAWWSRHILVNRYDVTPGKPYLDLLALVEKKEYFVLTTNVDHQFQLGGFDKNRLFYTQGDYGLWQCSKPCHDKTYDNEEAVRTMVMEQKDMKIPTELIPKCPVCGGPMTMNLRCDGSFVQDEGWYDSAARCKEFVRRYCDSRLLLLELGVGMNTPGIIKFPFRQLAAQNPKAAVVSVNLEPDFCLPGTEERFLCLRGDIGAILAEAREIRGKNKERRP